jgi:hypothetical protein
MYIYNNLSRLAGIRTYESLVEFVRDVIPERIWKKSAYTVEDAVINLVTTALVFTLNNTENFEELRNIVLNPVFAVDAASVDQWLYKLWKDVDMENQEEVDRVLNHLIGFFYLEFKI